MAKVNLKKVRKDFEAKLTDIWKLWDEAVLPEGEEDEKGEDPFSGTYWMEFIPFADQEREILREDRGWLEGVNAVTGWSLIRPGPREWSPRDR